MLLGLGVRVAVAVAVAVAIVINLIDWNPEDLDRLYSLLPIAISFATCSFSWRLIHCLSLSHSFFPLYCLNFEFSCLTD